MVNVTSSISQIDVWKNINETFQINTTRCKKFIRVFWGPIEHDSLSDGNSLA